MQIEEINTKQMRVSEKVLDSKERITEGNEKSTDAPNSFRYSCVAVDQ